MRAAILYVMDISEQCNKSLEEQIELFNNIKPLFTNKPIIVCLNKVDILTIDELPEDKKQLFKSFEEEGKGLFFISEFENYSFCVQCESYFFSFRSCLIGSCP